MKRLLLLFILSLGLGLLGLYFVSRDSLLDLASYRPTAWNGAVFVLCLTAFGIMWVLPYLRVKLLAQAQGYTLTGYTSFLAHVITVLGSAMTPSGSGGGPALVAALSRLGVPAGKGLGIAVQIFILDLFVFAWLIPLGLLYILWAGRISLPTSLNLLALLAMGVALVSAVALGRYPKPVVRGLLWLAKRHVLGRFRLRLRSSARGYYRSARIFALMKTSNWMVLQAVTFIGWISSFVLFWGLLRLYGVDVNVFDISAVLSIATLISFLVPTPGASGFMEVAVGFGAGGYVPPAQLAVPILLWRLSSFYIIYLIGPIAGWLLLVRNPPQWLMRTRRIKQKTE